MTVKNLRWGLNPRWGWGQFFPCDEEPGGDVSETDIPPVSDPRPLPSLTASTGRIHRKLAFEY